ncbi:MAG: hypothetical protein WAM70_20595, partial [Pyrinomonadaceae bacterium]
FKLRFRVVAAVLLAVIAWGSTVEVTHGHAATDTNLNAERVRNCIETAATDKTLCTSVQENEPARSSSRQNTSSECLICQLHHNLATTLLSQPAGVDPLHQQAARSSTPERLHLLEFTTVQHGRAPPTIL